MKPAKALLLILTLLLAGEPSAAHAALLCHGGRVEPACPAANFLILSAAGYDYVAPDAGCPYWTWLTSCYTSGGKGSTQSPQKQLSADAAFIAAHHLGTFQRLWVSLDQLMTWNATTGYQGYVAAYLKNLDDALARLHVYGITVDLVLFSYNSPADSHFDQFHPEALDGQHSAMRASYLRAVRDFVGHIAANATDSATVQVMDLQNEAYYQLEQYYGASMTVDTTIIYPWVRDLYNVAVSAAPQFRYTVSDTGRLLTDYATWAPLYPADVYDIHLYSDTPWANAAEWQNATRLRKSWFVGEAGCAPGNVSCTYDGTVSCAQPDTCALSVDSWWLANLRRYGASVVLVETPLLNYPAGANLPQINLVGQQVAAAN